MNGSGAGGTVNLINPDPWQELKAFTAARIALGRAGDSLPTQALLEFGLAHARARDAVHATLPVEHVARALHAAGYATISVQSAATDHGTYLRRPDLGRRLDAASRERIAAARPAQAPDVVFVVADGLAAIAAQVHAPALLRAIAPLLDARPNSGPNGAASAGPGAGRDVALNIDHAGWAIAPVIIATHSRVALGDEIGALLGARQVAMLIGERPGLSAPHSLGVYLTWAPHIGRTDAERNCISNIRPEGLGYAPAAQRLAWLLGAARQRQLTGVALKDESDAMPLAAGSAARRSDAADRDAN